MLLGIRLPGTTFGVDCQTIRLPLHRWALDKQSSSPSDKRYRRVPTPLRSTSPFSEQGRLRQAISGVPEVQEMATTMTVVRDRCSQYIYIYIYIAFTYIFVYSCMCIYIYIYIVLFIYLLTGPPLCLLSTID